MCGIDCAHRFISGGRPKCSIPAPCRLIRYDRSRRARAPARRVRADLFAEVG